MGEVYRARDSRLNRDVAIKVLPAAFARDHKRVGRFRREAQVLASLNHRNIASIHGLEEMGDAVALALEFVDGEDLAARVTRGALPVDEALAIAEQIAEGLEAAHEKGIVHRDLKPANIKITREGVVKILDFGLAKAFESDTDTALGPAPREVTMTRQMTEAGLILGTAAYMAPEQARGMSLDKRADIWAFGVLLFEMLSGRRPFVGPTLTDLLVVVVSAQPDWSVLPAGTPPSLVRLIRRCLEKDARRRLRDIGDARIEIESLMAGQGHADSSGSTPGLVIAPSRLRWREALMFLLGGGLAAGLALWLGSRPGSGESTVLRLNVALAPGTRLEDVLEAGRQTLALSHDASRLAYVGRAANGRRHIYLRRMESVAVEPIEGTAGGDMPFFSPDGTWLGFAADGKLKKVAIGGGQPTVICDAPEPRGASWGDNGTIVFAAAVRGGLSRVSALGGEPTPITTQAAGEDGHRWPLLLPGGQAALFNVEKATGREEDRTIDVVSLDTGERRTLVRAASYPRYVDGYLVYGQGGTLFAAPLDAGRLELTGPGIAILEDVRMDLRSTGRVFVDITPAGSLAYVPGFPRPGERSLMWIDRQGHSVPVTPEKQAFKGVRLSPDGQSLAVTIQEATDNLWIFDLRRTAWNRLTSEGDARTLAWTPDGQRVVFSSSKTGQPSLYWVSADGSGQPERLTPPTDALIDMPSIAPDGRTALVAVQNSRGDDIYSLSLEGPRTLEPFMATAAEEASPAISPSGRLVAYTSTESGRREVYVRPFGKQGRKWTVSTGGGSAPKWRRDERELFYLEGNRLMAAAVEGGAALTVGTPRVLFEESALSWSHADLFRYDVTADGQRFLIVKPEAREEAPLQIVVAPRFGEELQARLAGRASRVR